MFQTVPGSSSSWSSPVKVWSQADLVLWIIFFLSSLTLSDNLEITAETEDGLIMGVQHKQYNIHGVQFHPESIKTKFGMKILKNFVNYESNGSNFKKIKK